MHAVRSPAAQATVGNRAAVHCSRAIVAARSLPCIQAPMAPTTDCGCLINAPFSALAVMLMKEMLLMLPMGTVGSRSSEVIEIHSPLPHLQTQHTVWSHAHASPSSRLRAGRRPRPAWTRASLHGLREGRRREGRQCQVHGVRTSAERCSESRRRCC